MTLAEVRLRLKRAAFLHYKASFLVVGSVEAKVVDIAVFKTSGFRR